MFTFGLKVAVNVRLEKGSSTPSLGSIEKGSRHSTTNGVTSSLNENERGHNIHVVFGFK